MNERRNGRTKKYLDQTVCLLKLSHLESATLKVILHSAWRSNYNIHPSTQGTFLWLVWAATIQAQRAELVRFADPFKVGMHLQVHATAKTDICRQRTATLSMHLDSNADGCCVTDTQVERRTKCGGTTTCVLKARTQEQ